MNNTSNIIVGVVVVILIILGVLWYQDNKKTEMAPTTSSNTSGIGSLYIGVTDATADINNVSDISMQIKKVEIRNSAGEWVTVSSSSKVYNLLNLKENNTIKLYAQSNVPAGLYDRVRVTIGDSKVKTKSRGEVKAYVPASQIVFNMNINVLPNESTHLKLDILADQSLHLTADGQYVLALVIRAQSESGADVTVTSDEVVIVVNGKLDSDVSTGLDLDGTSRMNFKLDSKDDIKVEAPVGGAVRFMLNGKTYMDDGKDEESAEDSNESDEGMRANTNLNINSDSEKGDDSVKSGTTGSVKVNVY